ncbi:uridine diphosphate glucose pyrophosphatase NUDT22-like [Oratosquilla oratoria]|uniref:uridine diphosphate glucose pyrophosphatase NUDT22-like n=1 Tax=Oratosquilla oratoria TaxID=337810 RepID=UPI003F76B2FA
MIRNTLNTVKTASCRSVGASYRRNQSSVPMLTVSEISYGPLDLLCVSENATGLSRDQVVARFKLANARSRDDRLEKLIEHHWQTKTKANSRLYNGSKFRLAGTRCEDDKLLLDIGLTCYRDLCGTNLASSSQRSEWKNEGKLQHGNTQAFMANPIGVGIVLVTSDHQLVVGRRAAWTGEEPGMLDRPGGHAEPDNVFLSDGSLRPEHEGMSVDEAVMNEIWSSIVQEVEDELGLTKDVLGPVSLLGITLNRNFGGRPTLEFYSRLRMTGEQVHRIYSKGLQPEADETTAIHFLPPSTLQRLLQRLWQGYPEFGDEGLQPEVPKGSFELGDEEEVLREMSTPLKGALHLAGPLLLQLIQSYIPSA